MKNIYTFLFTAFIVLSISTTYGQPVLNAGDVTPVIGETFQIKTITSAVTPGSAGANQNWDFSTASVGGSNTLNIVAPSSTPHATSFPNATITVEASGNYDYYNANSTHYTRLGAYVSNVLLVYNDPQHILEFPLAYNNAFQDSFQTTFNSGGYNFTRTGKIESTVDGYGTIVTPEGTYTDVLRVKSIENYTDVSSVVTINYTTENYAWYRKDAHYPLFRYSKITSTVGNSTSAYFLAAPSVGIDDPFVKDETRVYPNPATGNVYLEFNSLENSTVAISIINMLGQQQYHVSEKKASGKNIMSIDISSLAAGIYLIQTEIDGKIFTKKLQVN